ncbi:hypothetical protein IHE44_0006076, partial [Lamprotornis superbus]
MSPPNHPGTSQQGTPASSPAPFCGNPINSIPFPPLSKPALPPAPERSDGPFVPVVKKKNKPLNLKIHNSVGSCENIPAQRSPLLSERSLRSFFVGYPPFLPSTPPVHTEATFSASKSPWPPQVPPPRAGRCQAEEGTGEVWSQWIWDRSPQFPQSPEVSCFPARELSEAFQGEIAGKSHFLCTSFAPLPKKLESQLLMLSPVLVFPVSPCRYAVSASLVPADPSSGFRKLHKTQYWMSQTCTVCGKGMLFGLKCKNCKYGTRLELFVSLLKIVRGSSGLKCHNKCTKEAPPCHLLIIHRGARLVRTESVPCDINNPLRKPPRYSDLHVSQTLPKTNKLNKDHIPVPYQPDSSSNPSSTTSSTPSSPAPPLPPSATPPSPLHPSPQCPRQQKQFNLPASHYYKYKQQFIFPDVVPETPTRAPQVVLHPVTSNPILEGNPLLQIEVEPTSENEEGAEEVQESEDDFEEMNLSLLSARNFPRKASQTSIFLQEWDIPFEQLEIGELIGKGRFGQVFHGRWHGEVAIRLIDIERDNEEQLKAFKREVMAYRQTRHENVVLFMGACMSPPHLAIITRLESFLLSKRKYLSVISLSFSCSCSLCKGRTLYSVVRDAKIVLDVNKTRQIAQEIVKGMGYLHAKGILHKDLKSKNVFYDNGKVVITDFGLFSISGVLQAGRGTHGSVSGRRENKLRIQNGWLCHLAPEIIRQLSPDTEEDKLPFSKHSDVFALGTIWYELHAREWPFKTQPAEAIIWQVGRGMKPNLSQIGMGKEISRAWLGFLTALPVAPGHPPVLLGLRAGGETH